LGKFSLIGFVVLDCGVWIQFLNPFDDELEALLGKRSKRVEVFSIEILSIDQVVHPYSMVVVLPDAVPQDPEVPQVHPVCSPVLDFTEQHSGRVEIVPAMVVVMQHQLPHVVDVEVLFLLVFHCLTEEKWDVHQIVPIDVSSRFHKCVFMVLCKNTNKVRV